MVSHIKYTEIGGLVDDAGYRLEYVDNASKITRKSDGRVNHPDDEISVQSIIDSFDPLPVLKAAKIEKLKEEGLSRINAVYPAIKSWDDLDLVKDTYMSVAPAARNPTADFQSMINIFQAGKNAAAEINGLQTEQAVADYDVTTSPVWP